MPAKRGRCDVTRRKGKTQTELNKRPIEPYEHKGAERLNNPPLGLVTPDTDQEAGTKKTYSYDQQIIWAGKAEHISLEVPPSRSTSTSASTRATVCFWRGSYSPKAEASSCRSALRLIILTGQPQV